MSERWDEQAVDGVDVVSAHRIKAPDEVLMEKEEHVDSDHIWDLVEVFRQVLCFTFYDPRCLERVGWDYAAAALEVLYREFAPSMWYSLPADDSARRRGVGLVSGYGAGVHELLRRADREALAEVLLRLGRGLAGKMWVLELTRRFYSLAKVLDESLLGGASLAKMGEIFGEANAAASRARWSERNQVVISFLAGDVVVRGRYQTCDDASERMRAAQMGNRNRVKSDQ
jgi:hypothetical protein